MNRIIYYFLSLTVLLDALNGFFVMYIPGILENGVPILRLIFLIYLMYKISQINRKKFFRICLITIVILLGLLIQNFMYISSLTTILSDIIYITKLLYFYILIEYILILNSKSLNLEIYNNILLNNSYLMPLLIIIPTILGLSRQTYQSSDLGSIGFYISNNSTNVVMILLTAVLSFNIWNVKTKRKTNILILLLMLYTLWLQASKTSYFLLVVLIVVNIFFYFKNNFLKSDFSYKILFINYFILISGVFFTIILIIYNKEIINNFSVLIYDFYKRQQYQIVQQESIIAYVNSGRFDLLANLINYFKNYSGFVAWIVGIGMSNIMKNIGRISEMDFFDIFFSTGVVGILITYGKFASLYAKIIKNKSTQRNVFLLLILFFIFLFSFFAGHVFVDIISSTFVCLIIGLSGVGKEKNKINDISNDLVE